MECAERQTELEVLQKKVDRSQQEVCVAQEARAGWQNKLEQTKQQLEAKSHELELLEKQVQEVQLYLCLRPLTGLLLASVEMFNTRIDATDF